MLKHRSTAGLVTLFIAVAVAVAGASAARVDPLLTKDEVEDVLGVTVVVDTRETDGFSFTSAPAWSVTIDPLGPAVYAMMPKGPDQAIEGVGDDAYVQLEMVNTVVLQAVKGSGGFVLSVIYAMGCHPAIPI